MNAKSYKFVGGVLHGKEMEVEEWQKQFKHYSKIEQDVTSVLDTYPKLEINYQIDSYIRTKLLVNKTIEVECFVLEQVLNLINWVYKSKEQNIQLTKTIMEALKIN